MPNTPPHDFLSATGKLRGRRAERAHWLLEQARLHPAQRDPEAPIIARLHLERIHARWPEGEAVRDGRLNPYPRRTGARGA